MLIIWDMDGEKTNIIIASVSAEYFLFAIKEPINIDSDMRWSIPNFINNVMPINIYVTKLIVRAHSKTLKALLHWIWINFLLRWKIILLWI